MRTACSVQATDAAHLRNRRRARGGGNARPPGAAGASAASPGARRPAVRVLADFGHLAPGAQVSPGGTGSHHGSTGDRRLNSSGGRPFGPRISSAGAGWSGSLPAEVTGNPQHRAGVRQGGMRREAVKDDHVARLVAGRRPAGLEPAERARRTGRPEVAAGLDGQAADPGGISISGIQLVSMSCTPPTP